MPITFNSFQAAIQGKNDNGFLELSSNNKRVDTYATGFFARTFGWYKTRAAETNREVRQQLFKALSEPGRCQANVLARIKSRLGLGSEGNGVQERPLSIREVRTMMEWAEKSTHVEKFSAQASQQFADSILSQFNSAMKKRLEDLPGDTKDTVLWDQVAKDVVRVGLGLTINGTRICNALDYKDSIAKNIHQAVSDAAKSFNAQTLHDKLAAKIISNIVHQGIGADISIAKRDSGDTMQGIGPGQLSKSQFASFDFKVQRQEDGSYDIDVDCVNNNLAETIGMEDDQFFTGNTRFSFSAKFKLSFGEGGAPNIGFRDQELPFIQSSKDKCAFNGDDIDFLTGIVLEDFGGSFDKALSSMMNAPELMHDPDLRTKMDELTTLEINAKHHPDDKKLDDIAKQKGAELRSFILDHVVTKNDQMRLAAMGIHDGLFKLLSTDWGGPRIDHKLMTQLKSHDEMEVARGVTTLQRMCKKAFELGYMSKEVVLNLSNTALVDVGGFSLDNAAMFKRTEVGILVEYCNRHPEERLIQDLNALDQEKVAKAKNKLHDILTMLGERRNAGLQLLEEHYGFAKGSIEQLRAKIDSETLAEMMEHIYQQDAEMDDTLETMRQTLEA